MAFSIERTAVEAKTHLKAEYSTELAQDLKAVHGLDGESNFLTSSALKFLLRSTRSHAYHLPWC